MAKKEKRVGGCIVSLKPPPPKKVEVKVKGGKTKTKSQTGRPSATPKGQRRHPRKVNSKLP